MQGVKPFLSCFSWSCVAAVTFLLPCIIMRSYALCQQVVAVLLPVLNRASYGCVSIPFESWASCGTLGFVDSTLCSFLKIWNVRMLSVLCWIVGHHSRSLGAYVIAFDVQKICYGCYGFGHVIKHEILFRFGLFMLRRWGVNLISSTCGYSQGKVKFITARKSRKKLLQTYLFIKKIFMKSFRDNKFIQGFVFEKTLFISNC